jgi:cytochrome c oxidase cbb3-type subunit I/II
VSAPDALADEGPEDRPAPRGGALQEQTITYNDSAARWFLFASVTWGIVGMLVGVIAATQLIWPGANLAPQLSFGRLRPLHTNAVIFAFVGNMMFAGVYYSTQRLLKARMASDLLSKIHFWGWQAIIVAAAITLPLGITQSKEYAELEWPIDIAIAVVWVLFAVNFFLTLKRRNEKHLYVAIWFYIATIITVAVLHVVNALSLPISATKSYSIYGGVQDALVQWWYGHNAVAFFLTTPILGIMYYFVPKAAERPVYSYRLSIVHFWTLVFMYIWAGPHHLLYTALPVWAQTVGMIFSLMLWAPSWGGMINGLLTLRGAWSKLRSDPVLRFFAAGITFYGMATFEGPLLSIKSVSALAHYTDWIVGHVHSAALGWNGLMAAGMFYWMVPRLYGKKLHSTSLANVHFWLATFGILFYMAAMWTAGVTQGLMLRATGEDGSLMYPDFIETVIAIRGPYVMRLVGGGMYLTGFIMMAFNLAKTALAGKPVDGQVKVVVAAPALAAGEPRDREVVFGRPVVLATIGLLALIAIGLGDGTQSIVALIVLCSVGVAAWVTMGQGAGGGGTWHRVLEGRAWIFSVFTVVAVLIGGIVELVPVVVIHGNTADPKRFPPYQALELEGRDVYIREGCYTCHSQMIRPFRHETIRYGEPSDADESAWDHPFQWGSKRTGPDLARVGVKYPNVWHYKHMTDPRSVSARSIMPAYAWLADHKVDLSQTESKVSAMRSLGVPYASADVSGAAQAARTQGAEVAADLRAQGVEVAPDSEMVALIAYLQRLGKPLPPKPGAAPVARSATPSVTRTDTTEKNQ